MNPAPSMKTRATLTQDQYPIIEICQEDEGDSFRGWRKEARTSMSVYVGRVKGLEDAKKRMMESKPKTILVYGRSSDIIEVIDSTKDHGGSDERDERN